MADGLLTPEEAADLLKCGLSTVYRLAGAGTLPAVKIPGLSLVRFRRERIQALLVEWEGGARRKRPRLSVV